MYKILLPILAALAVILITLNLYNNELLDARNLLTRLENEMHVISFKYKEGSLSQEGSLDENLLFMYENPNFLYYGRSGQTQLESDSPLLIRLFASSLNEFNLQGFVWRGNLTVSLFDVEGMWIFVVVKDGETVAEGFATGYNVVLRDGEYIFVGG
jgi:hypothetical protein